MHWFEHLASLYSERDIPLYHTMMFTDLEICLDKNGRLIGITSQRLPTVIPVTESSMSRTSAVCPHPLSDRLRYVVQGISEPHHSAYASQLNEWADSEHSTERLRAVRNLVVSGSLYEKLSAFPPDTMLRFTVDVTHLWEDHELFDAHICRMREQHNAYGFCCVTGEQAALAHFHPKHILPAADTAKLISAENKYQINSSCGFSIGTETSFKAHAVLRRIISESGVTAGCRTFAAWDASGNAVPLPFSDSGDICAEGNVTVIGLAAATKGRLSVTLLRRLPSEQYISHCHRWHEAGISARQIAEAAFGRPCKSGSACSEGVYGQTAERLLCCILDDTSLPSDIINAIKRRSPKAAERLHPTGDL